MFFSLIALFPLYRYSDSGSNDGINLPLYNAKAVDEFTINFWICFWAHCDVQYLWISEYKHKVYRGLQIEYTSHHMP
jgi:hypothetical protein